MVAQNRRRELRDAAIKAIAADGYSAVTVASICEVAGFSRGLIGHYFKGKEDLLVEAIAGVASELGDSMRRAVEAAGSDPLDRLHAVIRASFTPPGFTKDKVAVWVALVGNAKWSPPLAKIYQDLWRDYRRGIAGLMRRAADNRGQNFDFERAALTFSQLIEGFWVGWGVDPKAVNRREAQAACHAFLDLLFGETAAKR